METGSPANACTAQKDLDERPVGQKEYHTGGIAEGLSLEWFVPLRKCHWQPNPQQVQRKIAETEKTNKKRHEIPLLTGTSGWPSPR